MSSVIQDDDHQRSDVLISIWECDKDDKKGKKGNKEIWYCGICGNEYTIWNSTKVLIHLTRSGGNSIAQYISEILPKYQRQFKALKEKSII